MQQITALYARQSVEREDSLSIEGQLVRCRMEAEGHRYREYIDRGYSGKNTNRPAFQHMLHDILAGQIRRVIVYRLDRISRSILDFAQMMEMFEQKKVEFLSSTEHFDTSQPVGRAMLSICIVFAQLERETIQSRVLDTYIDRSGRGFYMGGRLPYGFSLGGLRVDGTRTSCYIPRADEIAVVQRIFMCYAAPGMGLAALARLLQEEGLSSRSGRAWNGARLGEILKNPIYCRADRDIYEFFTAQGAEIVSDAAAFIGVNGCYLFRGKSENKRTALAGTRLVLAPHEGVVDSSIWLACRRKLLDNQRTAPVRRGKSSWLCGRLRCAQCGYALVVVRSKSAAGRYFVCSGKGSAAQCEGLGTIYAEELEQVIAAQLATRMQEFCAPDAEAIAALHAQEEQYGQALERLADRAMQASGALMRTLSHRADQAAAKLEQVQARLAQSCKAQISRPRWEALSTRDKQRVLGAFIESIAVTAQELELVWRI